MGEKSKNIGDRGEEIVEYLFKELLGYNQYRSNIPLNCNFNEEHSKKENSSRRTHGIDGLVSYKTPLVDDCLEIGVISSKFTNSQYPKSNLVSKFKEHFIDLGQTLECFKFSDLKSQIEESTSGVEKTQIIGVLFWLSNHQDSFKEDTTARVSKAKLGNLGLKFDKLIYVDNERINFIIDVLEPLKQLFGKENYSFVFPDTGLNLTPHSHYGFGQKFPLTFFAYDMLPIRIQYNNDVIFYLACRKEFDTIDLKRIISLAKTFNHLQATSRTIISFANYNKLNHKDDVDSVLASFFDDDFVSQITIENYNNDFRNL